MHENLISVGVAVVIVIERDQLDEPKQVTVVHGKGCRSGSPAAGFSQPSAYSYRS